MGCADGVGKQELLQAFGIADRAAACPQQHVPRPEAGLLRGGTREHFHDPEPSRCPVRTTALGPSLMGVLTTPR